MEAVFLVIHVLVAVALIGIVLIQRSSSDGFGLGSGSGSNFMSGRQTANLLTRTTAILATVFIVNSLWLGILAANKADLSLADQIEKASKQPFETVPKAVEMVPDKAADGPAVNETDAAPAPAVPAAE